MRWGKNGEDLSFYSNKIEPVGLRKCPYDRWLTNKAYLSGVTVTNISQSFYLQDGDKNQLAWIRNKITPLSPYVLWWPSLCVVCLSARDHIFGTTRQIFTNFYGHGSVLLWRRSDTLYTSGFMDGVIFAHKPRLLDVAAQLKRSAHAALGLAINCAQQ